MKTKRTTISRGKNREVESIDEIYKILDEGLICHVSFIRDGYPVVLPVNYARQNDRILLHGGYESPFFQAMSKADDLCLNVTLLDGLVLTKSAYNHSVNYRSVVAYGKAQIVEDRAEKVDALKRIINQVVKNRWDSVRPPTEKELDLTMVLSIRIQECSAKSRTGSPGVASSDENYPVWSGVLPLSLKAGEPETDKFSQEILADAEIQNYNRAEYRNFPGAE
jgi:hypothetical protein